MNKSHVIKSAEDIKKLLDFYGGFHDCCIKELKYISGASVDKDKFMYFGESNESRHYFSKAVESYVN